MLGLFKRREPLDFAMIVGGCTPEARERGANWDNINVADASNPRAQEIAKYFIDFHKELFHKPESQGILEPSASLANFRALELVRNRTGKKKVLCTNLSHVSIERACRSLELEPIVIDVDPNTNYQVNEEDLTRIINEQGNDIAVVVSTHGTTQLGHIEDLAQRDLIKQLREEGTWLHIDAAYGGYLTHLSQYIQIPIPDADSVTVDPYKFVGRPGIALLLVNQDKISQEGVIYYVQSTFTSHTTLSVGPIVTWAQTVEDVTLERLADGCVEITRKATRELIRSEGRLILPPQTTTISVRLNSTQERERVHTKLLEEGYSVGKINIQGINYEVNGVRMVITPKVNPEYMFYSAMNLARKIGQLQKEQ